MATKRFLTCTATCTGIGATEYEGASLRNAVLAARKAAERGASTILVWDDNYLDDSPDQGIKGSVLWQDLNSREDFSDYFIENP